MSLLERKIIPGYFGQNIVYKGMAFWVGLGCHLNTAVLRMNLVRKDEGGCLARQTGKYKMALRATTFFH